MDRSKYWQYIKPLFKKPSFTSSEAKKAGIPPRMLIYFYEKGYLKRVSRGVYRSAEFESVADPQWEDLALISSSIPEAIICLVSALCYYDLTDEFMRDYWIAVPHRARAPKRENTRIIRMRNTSLGTLKLLIGEYEVRIFDRERTVIDCFRYLDKETAVKALQNYLKKSKNHKPNLPKLSKYAKILRVDLKPYIEAITT
ncbi:MAG: putative transcriptional regulator of viral defense system [Chlamydiales bacterium]|jgi:predicted transcriptional regulator of viral defense system